MFRRTLWLSLSLLVLLSLVLAACGGAQPTEVVTEEPVVTEAPTEEPAAPETTLVIWADETRAPILQALAADFEATYGVGLDVQQVADINDQLPIAAPAGEGPDIFIGPHDRLGGWVDSGLVAPIDLGDKADQFLQVALDGFTMGGQLYGMPYAIENMALFRNTDLAPEAPATWDELLQVGAELQTAGQVTYALALEDNGYKVYPVLTSFGGYIFGRSEDGTWDPTDLGVGGQGMIDAGNWIAENVAAGLISPSANDADTAQALFTTGEVPFMISGPWALEQVRTSGLNYAISPFPSNGQPFAGIQGFMINAFSENILMAQAFLTEFVATDPVMQQLREDGNRTSAFLPVYEATDDPDLAAFGEAGQNAALMPAIPEMGAVWGSWNSAVQLVITGADTPENAFATAAEQVLAALSGATAGMVNVPGDYQDEVGCAADWDPACEATAMTEGADGLWTSSLTLVAGDYQCKVALDGTWTTSYGVDGGGDNYTFTMAADGTVTFTYDPNTHLLTIATE